MEDRFERIRRRLGWVIFLLASLFLIVDGIIRLTGIVELTEVTVWALNIWEQFVISLYSVSFTLIALDPVLHSIDRESESSRESKAREYELVAKLGSRVRDVAVAAAEELRRFEWFKDDALHFADLRYANLSGANLSLFDLTQVNLEGATLINVDLSKSKLTRAKMSSVDLDGADLSSANLEEVLLTEASMRRCKLDNANLRKAQMSLVLLKDSNLTRADLSEALLLSADLSGCSLHSANLQKANLMTADLRGADLSEADMTGAHVMGTGFLHIGIPGSTKFDRTTRLPDGRYWHEYCDVGRYLNPAHPNYWKPGMKKWNQKSPHYVSVECSLDESNQRPTQIIVQIEAEARFDTPNSRFMTRDNDEVVIFWIGQIPPLDKYWNSIHAAINAKLNSTVQQSVIGKIQGD